MAPPHLAQWQIPVSSVGPLTTRAGWPLGVRTSSRACTVANGAGTIGGGTPPTPCSFWGFSSLALVLLLLIERADGNRENLPPRRCNAHSAVVPCKQRYSDPVLKVAN